MLNKQIGLRDLMFLCIERWLDAIERLVVLIQLTLSERHTSKIYERIRELEKEVFHPQTAQIIVGLREATRIEGERQAELNKRLINLK